MIYLIKYIYILVQVSFKMNVYYNYNSIENGFFYFSIFFTVHTYFPSFTSSLRGSSPTLLMQVLGCHFRYAHKIISCVQRLVIRDR